ncbi:MAG TPA: anti-sigma factor [Candidatus Limnocylindrales bacterium]
MNTDLRNDDAFVDRLTAYLDQRADRGDHADDGGGADIDEGIDADLVADALADADVAEFAALTNELRAPATWGAPPPDLRDAILSRVREQAEAVVAPVAQPVPDVSPPARTRESRWRPRWGRLTWAVPVAAFAAAVFAVGIVIIDRTLLQSPPAGETYVATGTELAPGARATVTVTENPPGFSLRVQADGLPGAADGSYYSAWLHGPRGVVPLGSFHQRKSGSSVALWSGVDPKDYTTLVITLQAEGEPPSPTDLVVMTATLKH